MYATMWVLLLLSTANAYAQDKFDYTPKINTDLTSLDATKCMQPKNNSKIHNLNKIVLKKCCPVGFHHDEKNDDNEPRTISYCQKSINKSLSISVIYSTVTESLIYYEAIVLENPLKIVVGVDFKHALTTDGTLFLTQRGTLLDIDDTNCVIMEHKKYCIDISAATGQLTGFYDTDSIYTFDAAIYLLIPCMVTSILSLIATILIYASVDRFQNLLGISLISLCCFMLVNYCCYIVRYAGDKYDDLMYVIIRYSFICSGFWFVVIWSDICWHTWYYLPKDKQRRKLHTCILFISLTTGLVLFVACLAYFGVSFKAKKWIFKILIGIMLTSCIGMAIATFIGFKRLTEERESALLFEKQAQTLIADRAANPNAAKIGFVIPQQQPTAPPPILRTYSSKHIEYVNAMCWSSVFILCMQCLCIIIKWATKTSRIEKPFEMFNSLVGVFILIVFVGLPNHWRDVRTFWMSRGH